MRQNTCVIFLLAALAAGATGDPSGTKTLYEVRWLNICDGCVSNPFGITENGIISGNVGTPVGERGFLLGRDTSLTYVDVPGNIFIELLRGTNSGEFVGVYLSPVDWRVYGFVRDRQGGIRTFWYPGAAVTVAGSITQSGDIVGSYTSDPTAAVGWVSFIERSGSFPLTFQYPGANVSGTIALGINASGTIVGVYTLDGSSALHAFVRQKNGTFLSINYPGALQTYLTEINEPGAAVGFWQDASGAYHGLLYQDGLCYTIDPGLSPAGFKNTTLTGINNAGQLVGVNFPVDPGDGDGFLLTRAASTGTVTASSPGVACAVPVQ